MYNMLFNFNIKVISNTLVPPVEIVKSISDDEKLVKRAVCKSV